MERKNLTTIAIIAAVLGGCTLIQAGPKHLWSSNVLKDADERNWICVGTMKGGDITNPVTWFFGYPIRHYFVAQRSTSRVPGTNDEWLVQEYMMNPDEGQTTFTTRYDLSSNKLAFIGSTGVNGYDKEYMLKNMSNPKWKDIANQWDKNTARWLKDGRPLNVDYCD